MPTLSWATPALSLWQMDTELIAQVGGPKLMRIVSCGAGYVFQRLILKRGLSSSTDFCVTYCATQMARLSQIAMR
jgi:hypothetical protein